MPKRTAKYTLMPWQGGLNTSLDQALIPNEQLRVADNVVFGVKGSRQKREGVSYVDATSTSNSRRSSSGTTRTVVTNNNSWLVGESITITGTGPDTDKYTGTYTITSVADHGTGFDNQLTYTGSSTFAESDAVNTDMVIESNGTTGVDVVGLKEFWRDTGSSTYQRIVGVMSNGVVFLYKTDGSRERVTNVGTAIGTSLTQVTMSILNNVVAIGFDDATIPKKLYYNSSSSRYEIDDLGVRQVTDIEFAAATPAGMNAQYLIVYDESGSVAFWVDTDDSGTPEPAHGADRAVEITTVVTGDTDAQIATKFATAVSADSQFSSPAPSGTVIRISDAKVGFRAAATSSYGSSVMTDILLGFAPPNFSLVSEHSGRWVSNDKDRPHRLHYSSILPAQGALVADLQWQGFGDSSAIDIGTGDGDPVGLTAIFPSFKGDLFVAKKTKLYRLPGFNIAFAPVIPVSKGIGCISHNSAIAVDQDDVVFASNRGFHSLAATDQFGDFSSSFISRDIQTSFKGFEAPNLDRIVGAYLPEINSIMFGTTDGGDSDNGDIYLFNSEFKSWYHWTGISCVSMTTVFYSDELSVFCGTNNGRLLRTQNGLARDEYAADTAIPLSVSSGTIYPDKNPSSVKGFKKLYLIYKPQGDYDIEVDVTIDNYATQTLTFPQLGNPALLGSTFVLGASRLGVDTVLAPVGLSIDGYGHGCQIEIRQSGLNEKIEVYGFIIEYEPAGDKQEQ